MNADVHQVAPIQRKLELPIGREQAQAHYIGIKFGSADLVFLDCRAKFALFNHETRLAPKAVPLLYDISPTPTGSYSAPFFRLAE